VTRLPGLIDYTANVIGRTKYDAYGNALHFRGCDVDGDRDADSGDSGAINTLLTISGGSSIAITSSAYRAEYDLNRDGAITSADANMVSSNTGTALTAGLISLGGSTSSGIGGQGGPDNPIGYCGYVFNTETRLYTVRFRHYWPALGTWQARDPAGYIDGGNLYEYCQGMPATVNDPRGRETKKWDTYTPVKDENGQPAVMVRHWTQTTHGWFRSWLGASSELTSKSELVLWDHTLPNGEEVGAYYYRIRYVTTNGERLGESEVQREETQVGEKVVAVGAKHVGDELRANYGWGLVLSVLGMRAPAGSEGVADIVPSATRSAAFRRIKRDLDIPMATQLERVELGALRAGSRNPESPTFLRYAYLDPKTKKVMFVQDANGHLFEDGTTILPHFQYRKGGRTVHYTYEGSCDPAKNY
jgi:RHS repeat-associated protein